MTQEDVLQGQRQTLKFYLQMKVEQEDWHGVADAAMDLREIETALGMLRLMRTQPTGAN